MGFWLAALRIRRVLKNNLIPATGSVIYNTWVPTEIAASRAHPRWTESEFAASPWKNQGVNPGVVSLGPVTVLPFLPEIFRASCSTPRRRRIAWASPKSMPFKLRFGLIRLMTEAASPIAAPRPDTKAQGRKDPRTSPGRRGLLGLTAHLCPPRTIWGWAVSG